MAVYLRGITPYRTPPCPVYMVLRMEPGFACQPRTLPMKLQLSGVICFVFVFIFRENGDRFYETAVGGEVM